MKKIIIIMTLFTALNCFSQKTTYTIISKEVCHSDNDIDWNCGMIKSGWSSISIELGNTGEYELGTVYFTDAKSKVVYDNPIYSMVDSNAFTIMLINAESTVFVDALKKTITIIEPYNKEIYKFK